jgi:hypothetical protein
MRLFARQPQASPEAETAKRAAEKSLQQAQARMPEAQARLIESRRVTEQLQAHNRATYTGLADGLLLGRKPTAAS